MPDGLADDASALIVLWRGGSAVSAVRPPAPCPLSRLQAACLAYDSAAKTRPILTKSLTCAQIGLVVLKHACQLTECPYTSSLLPNRLGAATLPPMVQLSLGLRSETALRRVLWRGPMTHGGELWEELGQQAVQCHSCLPDCFARVALCLSNRLPHTLHPLCRCARLSLYGLLVSCASADTAAGPNCRLLCWATGAVWFLSRAFPDTSSTPFHPLCAPRLMAAQAMHGTNSWTSMCIQVRGTAACASRELVLHLPLSRVMGGSSRPPHPHSAMRLYGMPELVHSARHAGQCGTAHHPYYCRVQKKKICAAEAIFEKFPCAAYIQLVSPPTTLQTTPHPTRPCSSRRHWTSWCGAPA